MGTGHVWLNGAEITSDVDLETAEIEEQANRLNGIFDFDIRDERPVTGQAPLSVRSRDEVLVYDDATLTWGGQLALPRRSRDGKAIEYHCKAQSFDCLLDQRVIESMAGAPAAPCYDDDLVGWIVSFGSALGLTTVDYVSRLRTVAFDVVPDVSGKTLRQALDTLGSHVGSATYWVDPAKKVHWTDPGSAQQVRNADFEGDSVIWSLDASAAIVDGNGAGGAGDSALTTTGNGAGWHVSSQTVTGIVGNRRYLFAADLWSSVAGQAIASVQWLDAAETMVGASYPVGSGASTWVRIGVILTAPATATHARVSCQGASAVFTGTLRHDNFALIGETAAFGISTSPNGSTTRSYEGWEEAEDAITPVNRVLVRGTGISGWREHAGSIAYYRGKRFEAILDDERVTTADGIDSRSAWVFSRYAYPALAGKYVTRTAGLHAGTWQIIEEGVLGVKAMAWITTLRTTFEQGQTRYAVAYGVPEDDLGAALAAVSIAFAGSEPTVNSPVSGTDVVAPATPTGLTLETGADLAPDGTLRSFLLSSWTANADVDLDGYELQIDAEATFTNPTTSRTGAISHFSENVIPGLTYYARLRALDRSGNASGWTSAESLVAGNDDDAPAVPSGLAAISGIRLIGLSWQRVVEPDLATYQVRWGVTADDAPPGTPPEDWTRANAALNLLIVAGLDPGTTYWFTVRALDRSGNVATSVADPTAVAADAFPDAGWADPVSAIPSLVIGSDIAAGSILTSHLSAEGIDAGAIRTGTLEVGGVPGIADALLVYDSFGREVGRWDGSGFLATDPAEPAKRVRIVDGVLAFSTDAGATWTTALDGSGIRADAITLGTAPGGHNAIPNASFELAAFTTLLSKVWTATADWAATIGTDVNVTKTGASLVQTTYAY